MSSKLRKTTTSKPGELPKPTGTTAYLLVYEAVKHQPGLIHGKFDDDWGGHCAIGSYWADHPKTALDGDFIDEVALVNDSLPRATPEKRRAFVLRWLRWKLQQVGFPLPGRKLTADPTNR